MENRTKKLVKVGATITSLALVGAVSIGLTTAYLNASTVEKTNTFSSSANVITTLTEPSWGDRETKSYKPGDTVDKDPQVNIAPHSENAYLAATVEFKLQNWKGEGEIALTYGQFKTLATIYGVDKNDFTTYDDGADGKWVLGEGVSLNDSDEKVTLYYVNGGTGTDADDLKVMAPTNITDSIFEKVEFKDTTEFESALKTIYRSDTSYDGKTVKIKDKYPNITIEVKSYAVQADNLDLATAKSELNGMIG